MSEKTNPMKAFMPMFPGMDAMPDFFAFARKGEDNDPREKWDDFKSKMAEYWEQLLVMQDSTVNASKEQWTRFFNQFQEMQDIFAASLPDETPSLPGIPVFLVPAISPRAFMGKMKAFQEMANEHAMQQMDSFVDFCKKGQKQVKETVVEAVKNVEEKADKEVEAIEEKKAAARTRRKSKKAEQAPEEPVNE